MSDKSEIFLQENMGVDGETTWADSRITDDDIKYVRSDIVPKILTIEELRKQFEGDLKGFWLSREDNGDYMDDRLDSNWESYLRCARVNNLTKE